MHIKLTDLKLNWFVLQTLSINLYTVEIYIPKLSYCLETLRYKILANRLKISKRELNIYINTSSYCHPLYSETIIPSALCYPIQGTFILNKTLYASPLVFTFKLIILNFFRFNEKTYFLTWIPKQGKFFNLFLSFVYISPSNRKYLLLTCISYP